MKISDMVVAKRAAAAKALEWVEDGMLLGLGTGSTVEEFIYLLAERCRQGLRVACVPTSRITLALAKEQGIPMTDLAGVTRLDLAVDGADEIDPQRRLIKGGGGALLWEKIVASISDEMVVIADESKKVLSLGSFPLPIEIVPFGADATLRRIHDMKCPGTLRCNQQGTLFQTDSGHYIADVDMRSSRVVPEKLDVQLRSLPGVVETGLFLNLAGRVVLGQQGGGIEIIKP